MKDLKIPPKPERKTWGFEEKDEELVKGWAIAYQKASIRLTERTRKADQKLRDRLWKKVYAVMPTVRGMKVELKFDRAGKPYVEEEA